MKKKKKKIQNILIYTLNTYTDFTLGFNSLTLEFTNNIFLFNFDNILYIFWYKYIINN